MSARSPLERVLTRLYRFDWSDALVSGGILAVAGVVLVLTVGLGGPVGYVANFLLSLGLFAVLIGVLWGVASLVYAKLTK